MSEEYGGVYKRTSHEMTSKPSLTWRIFIYMNFRVILLWVCVAKFITYELSVLEPVSFFSNIYFLKCKPEVRVSQLSVVNVTVVWYSIEVHQLNARDTLKPLGDGLKTFSSIQKSDLQFRREEALFLPRDFPISHGPEKHGIAIYLRKRWHLNIQWRSFFNKDKQGSWNMFCMIPSTAHVIILYP